MNSSKKKSSELVELIVNYDNRHGLSASNIIVDMFEKNDT